MSWLLRRLREPSTWRGLVWLATVAGLSLRPEQAEAIVTAGMALAGLLGVFTTDAPKTVRVELPPIELVAQEGRDFRRPDDLVERRDPVADGMRGSVPSRPGPDADTQPNGWHQSGWGDK